METKQTSIKKNDSPNDRVILFMRVCTTVSMLRYIT